MLPKDYPPWQTVYDHFRRLNKRGIWKKILFYLNKHARKKEGREGKPTHGLVDSQSVKTVYGSKERGFDGGKKNKRKKASHLY